MGFEYQGASVIDYHIEKRDPALRNIHSAVVGSKLETEIDGCQVYWFLINTNNEQNGVDHYLNLNEVELCIPAADFTAFTQSIRGLKGVPYLDACDAFTESLPIKKQSRGISYNVNKFNQNRKA